MLTKITRFSTISSDRNSPTAATSGDRISSPLRKMALLIEEDAKALVIVDPGVCVSTASGDINADVPENPDGS